MTEREFCYWLQGLFEIGKVETLDSDQTKIIKNHLALVFHKVTPSVGKTEEVPPRKPIEDFAKVLRESQQRFPPLDLSKGVIQCAQGNQMAGIAAIAKC